MAEDDTPKMAEDDVLPPTVPSREPFPPPPDISYVRPNPQQAAGTPRVSQVRQNAVETQAREELGFSSLKLGSGLAAGTTFAASIIAGFLIGQWIDHRWNHSGGLPWGTLIFGLAGVAAGFLNLFRVISATDRKNRDGKK